MRTKTSRHALTDVAAEALNLAGGGRALLLQIAHPAVGRGVVEHSDFADRMMDRLHATMTYVYASVFASPDELAYVRRSVNRAHAPVHAAAHGDEPAYNAFDPHLQLWVAATLYDSMVTLYERLFGRLPPDEAERLYRDFAVVGSGLQVPAELWPADRRAFAEYWETTLATLRPTPATREVARQLLYPRGVPWWLRMLLPQARLVTAGLLPPRLRAEFGLAWNDRAQRRFDAWMRWTSRIYPLVPAGLRHRPKELYLRRLRDRMRQSP
ncbi:oxygenase MpaB family protein [Leifsonia sp. NPDC058248]|uniref:oxygenase MpaB family protein n=1 Tax=Leifsonia sp. NPDC058248 TaxID=3346402 RepID=UPI0036DF5040